MIHATKECTVTFGTMKVEGVEADMVVFVPKKTELALRNDSKAVKAIMRVEMSVYHN